MSDRTDVCVFGANGFTGKFVALSYAKIHGLHEDKPMLLSGRNQSKLEKVRDFIASELGLSSSNVLNSIKITLADVSKPKTLTEMASKAKLVLNCVGPYRLYGEAVVKACLETKTHYIDICGEPEFMEKMELLYNDQAKEAGIVIVSACGFDAVPAELAIEYARDQLGDSSKILPIGIESFLKISGITRGCGNYATYESAILGFESAAKGGLTELRKKLKQKRKVSKPSFHPRLPKLKFKGQGFGTYEPLVSAHIFPLPTCDASVVKRSQLQLEELRMQHAESDGGEPPVAIPPPVQFALYGVMSPGYRTQIARHGAMIRFLSRWSWGRKVLLNNPSFFTAGTVAAASKTPSDEARASTKISIDAYATGIERSKVDSLTADEPVVPTVKVHIRLTATDPGYAATGDIAAICAETILNESLQSSPLRLRSGVVTPASVLRGTTVIERLQKVGVTLEVVPWEQ